jgi:hypothetical protein
MSRALNVFEFRRVNMHGTKSGPHADPDYRERYHPGSGDKIIDIAGPSSRVKEFIDRFYDMTQTNPLMPSARVSRDAKAMMEIAPYGDGVYLKSIQSLYPGERTGGATDMMRSVFDLADELGVTLHGVAKKYGTHEGFLTQRQLVAWYKRLGFEVNTRYDPPQVKYRPGSRG